MLKVKRVKGGKKRFLKKASPVVVILPLAACGGNEKPVVQAPPAPKVDPSDIALSTALVDENINNGTSIGVLTTTDGDSTNHTYTVDDDRFEVVGDALKLKAGNSLNYEAETSIDVSVTTTDSDGGSYSETFTIGVTNVNDAPTNTSLSSSPVEENDKGVVIGNLTVMDEDVGDSFTYSVSDDRFEIVGAQLKLKADESLDYEVENTVSIDVTTTDSGGLTDTETFSITVNDNLEVLQQIVINGIDADDFSGFAVSSAGDINGDGFDDIIIGAQKADPGGAIKAGESYVVFGTDQGFDTNLDLSTLAAGDGSKGFVINGINNSDTSGYSVSSAGDVNGDGIDDIIIGATSANANGASASGESYVIFGSDLGFNASFELSTLASSDGSKGFVINGIDLDDYSGVAVSSAGDVNGDGIDDIIIGADGADPNGASRSGESYVVFGSDLGFNASFELSTLASGDGSSGFVINGIDASDSSGSAVSSAGDVNGDGIDDIIVGAPSADANGVSDSGESYVIFGSDQGFNASFELSTLASGDGSKGFVINGFDNSGESGESVSSAGDVNGDGLDDIIIGAYYTDANGASDSGESYVLFGSDQGFNASFELSTLTSGDGSKGFVISGIEANTESGTAVSSAGDINGDGFDDIIIGAPRSSPDGVASAGESYVIFGTDQGFGANFDLNSLASGDGSKGFVINGIDINDLSGEAVSSAGDVNGDGIDDIIIGAHGADGDTGESYLILGHGGSWDAELDLSLLPTGGSRHFGTANDDDFTATTDTDIFDVNVLDWGNDTIIGFTDGTDMIDLSGTGLAFGDLTITQDGADTLISATGGNSVTLDAILATDVSTADFIL